MTNFPLRQRGVTLLEVLVSIGILATITAGIAALASQQSDDTRAAVTALHLKTTGDATSEYIKNNYAAITGIATATKPALIRVSDLIAGGVLPAGYATANPRGQATCALVLQPTPNNLIGMVVTEGGDTIDDLTLGQIAATVGASGGGIYSTATTTFRGAMGSYSVPIGNFANANHLNRKCNGTGGAITLAAGHNSMALWFADGLSTSATLYRDAVPGNTALNTMNTPILMASVQATGAFCAAGAIARDAAGKVLSCQSGVFAEQGGSAYWKDPVPNVAGLPACNAAALGHTRVVHTPAVGTGPRAYTCNGATWQPLAVDNAGNLTVPGQLSLGANNRILGGGAQGPYGATTIAGSKNGWTGVEYRDGAGNYQINHMTNRSNIGYYDAAAGRWLNYMDTSGNQTLDQTGDYNSGRINPGWAVETWGCSTGQIAKASYTIADGWAWNGKTLSCVSGVWRSMAPAPGKTVTGFVCGKPYGRKSNACTIYFSDGTQMLQAWGDST